tara:strand:- start:165267 stop:166370 length:1104 start_codon:yes stop_codon:yes gene_type:complete
MSSTIDKHISHLLFDHECVTVSGFGSFIIRDYPAEINIATHMFRPASKRVSFNPSIKENDGLLAKQISSAENIAYRQANESISISVRSWQRILRSGKKVNLPGIGRLYMDEANRLQFNPAIEINYDRHSYGLNIFRAPSLQRELKIETTIHNAIEAEIPSKTIEERSRRSMPLFFKAASITALLGISLSSVIYFTDINQNIKSFSGLNPLSIFNSSSSSEDLQKDKSTFNVPTKSEENNVEKLKTSDSVEPSTEGTNLEGIKKKVSENKAISEFQKDASKSEAKAINENINSNLASYHIVVGSFTVESNAINYLKSLKSQGYEAYLANGSSKFKRVAIGNYRNSLEAQKNLLNIKKELNPSAWVYHN